MSQLPTLYQLWPKAIENILEKDIPSPFYFYSEEIIQQVQNKFIEATGGRKNIFPHFAVKSNNNGHVLKFFSTLGYGADVVSLGEMDRAIKYGFSPDKIVFSGVGKTDHELLFALKGGVGCLNIESASEVFRIEKICEERKIQASVAIRVNPDIEAGAHPYIATGLAEHKFGVDMIEAQRLYVHMKNRSDIFKIKGVAVHIGSQMLSQVALSDAMDRVLDFVWRLQRLGIQIKNLDMGGGIGIPYHEPSQFPPFEKFGPLILKTKQRWTELVGEDGTLSCEPGRSFVAQSGFLISRVVAIKETEHRTFAIVDAGMTDLIRPALYQATHPMILLNSHSNRTEKVYDVVGPVCESSDVLGRGVRFPELEEGDFIAILCAGAYGHTMSSCYNGCAIPAEWWLPKNSTTPQVSTPRREFEI